MIYRFSVADGMNTWAKAVEIEADNPDQAYKRAESWLFTRRDVGDHDLLVRLTLEPADG